MQTSDGLLAAWTTPVGFLDLTYAVPSATNPQRGARVLDQSSRRNCLFGAWLRHIGKAEKLAVKFGVAAGRLDPINIDDQAR